MIDEKALRPRRRTPRSLVVGAVSVVGAAVVATLVGVGSSLAAPTTSPAQPVLIAVPSAAPEASAVPRASPTQAAPPTATVPAVAPPAPLVTAPSASAGPADASCDANYVDACVPVDRDVDCAGGTGDGPSYLEGTARVAGTDVYELDRDANGVACD